jgi:iron(III) transport system substrate-binding protein
VDGPNKSGHDGLRLLASCIAAGLLLAAPAAAQQLSAAEQAEWDKIVAAANAEGSLIMSSQPNKQARDYLHAEWSKAYPKIDLSLSVIPAGQLIARIRTERAAGKYLWDVAVSGGNTAYDLSKDGAIDPLRDYLFMPDVKSEATWGSWDRVFFDKERKYMFAISAALKSPYYNKQYVTQAEIDQKKLEILLDPKYRGKFIWHDPSIAGSGQSFGLILKERLGEEKLKYLLIDQRTTIVPQQEMVVEALARGTHWIGLGPWSGALMKPYLDAGLKIEVQSFGNDPDVNEMSMGGAGLYVYNKPPHPNAAKVFVNWILSKEIQLGLAKVMLQDSRRTDLPSVSEPDRVPRPGAKYFETQREEYVDDIRAAGRWISEVRKQAR